MNIDKRIILALSFFIHALLNYHKRFFRVISHLFPFKYTFGRGFTKLNVFFEWVFSLFLLMSDLLFAPEIICSIYVLFNKRIRRLTPKEETIKSLLFKNGLKLPFVMNENASIMTRKGSYAFVSFYLINSYGRISDKLFAHELIHIYQFSRYGSPYIIRSLLAQRSKEGYNYGGIKGLNFLLKHNLPATSLNYEQQGDVLADYYEIISNPQLHVNYDLQSRKIVYEYICHQWI